MSFEGDTGTKAVSTERVTSTTKAPNVESTNGDELGSHALELPQETNIDNYVDLNICTRMPLCEMSKPDMEITDELLREKSKSEPFQEPATLAREKLEVVSLGAVNTGTFDNCQQLPSGSSSRNYCNNPSRSHMRYKDTNNDHAELPLQGKTRGSIRTTRMKTRYLRAMKHRQSFSSDELKYPFQGFKYQAEQQPRTEESVLQEPESEENEAATEDHRILEPKDQDLTEFLNSHTSEPSLQGTSFPGLLSEIRNDPLYTKSRVRFADEEVTEINDVNHSNGRAEEEPPEVLPRTVKGPDKEMFTLKEVHDQGSNHLNQEFWPGDYVLMMLEIPTTSSMGPGTRWTGVYRVDTVNEPRITVRTLDGMSKYCQDKRFFSKIRLDNFRGNYINWKQAAVKYREELKTISVNEPEIIDLTGSPPRSSIVTLPADQIKSNQGVREDGDDEVVRMLRTMQSVQRQRHHGSGTWNPPGAVQIRFGANNQNGASTIFECTKCGIMTAKFRTIWKHQESNHHGFYKSKMHRKYKRLGCPGPRDFNNLRRYSIKELKLDPYHVPMSCNICENKVFRNKTAFSRHLSSNRHMGTRFISVIESTSYNDHLYGYDDYKVVPAEAADLSGARRREYDRAVELHIASTKLAEFYNSFQGEKYKLPMPRLKLSKYFERNLKEIVEAEEAVSSPDEIISPVTKADVVSDMSNPNQIIQRIHSPSSKPTATSDDKCRENAGNLNTSELPYSEASNHLNTSELPYSGASNQTSTYDPTEKLTPVLQLKENNSPPLSNFDSLQRIYTPTEGASMDNCHNREMSSTGKSTADQYIPAIHFTEDYPEATGSEDPTKDPPTYLSVDPNAVAHFRRSDRVSKPPDRLKY